VVAIFGNEEFENTKRKLKREYSDIIWLDDEQVQVKGIDIFGTTGVLDEPRLGKAKMCLILPKYMKNVWKQLKHLFQNIPIVYC